VDHHQLILEDGHGEAPCTLSQINTSREVGLGARHFGKRLADELGRLFGREL
jgi:hypothetical protein